MNAVCGKSFTSDDLRVIQLHLLDSDARKMARTKSFEARKHSFDYRRWMYQEGEDLSYAN